MRSALYTCGWRNGACRGVRHCADRAGTGVLAGLGYWVAGIPAPALWGVITALISLIPFIGPVIWIGLSLSLLAHGETQAALGLFMWGALVVSSVDNLIRPLVISGPTRIPLLLVFLACSAASMH